VRTLSAGLEVGPERPRASGQRTEDDPRQLHPIPCRSSPTPPRDSRSSAERRTSGGGSSIAASPASGRDTSRDLSRYGRVVKQRNSLLQQIAEGKKRGKELDAWDRELVRDGAGGRRGEAGTPTELASRTAEWSKARLPRARSPRRYEPSGRFEKTGSALERGSGPCAAPEVADRLTRSSGPHRDNIEILRGGNDPAEILSSGEIKMTVLFLKLAKMELYRERTGDRPLFLLDDVDAELDLSIIERLIYLSGKRSAVYQLAGRGAFRPTSISGSTPASG
jgi:DNA replication and repair protein RecF